MTMLAVPVYRRILFTYHADSRSYSTEASNLCRGRDLFGRIYDDACDEGCAIASDGGLTATFAVARVQKDREDDVQFWELIPTRETVRKIPALAGCTVLIFND